MFSGIYLKLITDRDFYFSSESLPIIELLDSTFEGNSLIPRDKVKGGLSFFYYKIDKNKGKMIHFLVENSKFPLSLQSFVYLKNCPEKDHCT